MHVSRAPRPTVTLSPEWITGDAWTEEIAAPDGPSRLQIDDVEFAPGARTLWHRHPIGQVLIITHGTGFVQRRGDAVETVRVGDTVRIGPGEWHWHGGTPATSMRHLVIEEIAEDGRRTERGEVVTDAEFHASPLAPNATEGR